jgi:hypothetical protein
VLLYVIMVLYVLLQRTSTSLLYYYVISRKCVVLTKKRSHIPRDWFVSLVVQLHLRRFKVYFVWFFSLRVQVQRMQKNDVEPSPRARWCAPCCPAASRRGRRRPRRVKAATAVGGAPTVAAAAGEAVPRLAAVPRGRRGRRPSSCRGRGRPW